MHGLASTIWCRPPVAASVFHTRLHGAGQSLPTGSPVWISRISPTSRLAIWTCLAGLRTLCRQSTLQRRASNAKASLAADDLTANGIRRVHMGSTRDRGRCLLATEDAEPGDVLIREKASFVHDMGSNVSQQGAEEIWMQFHQLPSETQAAILGLFCPEQPVRALEDSPGYMLASDDQRRLLGILKVNSVKLRGPGAGVFLTISRANHSCRPNCAFVLSDDATCGLVAIQEIKADEEITVSYISESNLLLPILQRRSALLRPWQFTCACPRCVGVDDTRGLRCSLCGRGVQWASAESDEWQACGSCKGHMDEQEMRRCLSRWWLRYNAMAPLHVEAELAACEFRRGGGCPPERKDPDWMSEVVSLHRSMRDSPAPAPGLDTHWIGSSVAAFAAEAHLWRGELEEAVAAATARATFVKRVLQADTLGLKKVEATRELARRMKEEEL
ncbi:Smyd3 [Symbiodinium natans]|uniref:Smyd3 protein n=1 Tax=Symbiodinium natans TaxID=878477 RepID=A0A812J590_9DINO|nr:Smyd3 [Symbiodinium natans]